MRVRADGRACGRAGVMCDEWEFVTFRKGRGHAAVESVRCEQIILAPPSNIVACLLKILEHVWLPIVQQ